MKPGPNMPDDSRESGVAIILALFMTILVAGLCLSGGAMLKAHRMATTTNHIVKMQAVHAARSGLTEATSWLRRQTSQPVLTFTPVLAPTNVPPILDTIDPVIGLVREFPITDKQWARYEVWRAWPGDPVPARAAMRALYQCEDVSSARGANAMGSVWRVRSVGYVYSRVNPNVPFNQLPNTVLGKDVLETEVRRLVLNLPGQAALNVSDGNACHINTNGRIVGGSAAGVYFPSASGEPTTGPASQQRVTGSPDLASPPSGVTYDDSYQAVFGLSYSELRAMANYIVTDEDDFPSPVPMNTIVVVETTSMQWTASRPLLGTGIVIVTGNAMISDGSDSNFEGMLYVDGNLTVRGPSEVRGAVVCTGNVTVQGVPDYATIAYDSGALTALTDALGSYNRASALLRIWDGDK